MACRILVSDQRWNLGPRQEKCQVLTTETTRGFLRIYYHVSEQQWAQSTISFIFAFLVSRAVSRTEQGLNKSASYVEIACIKWNTLFQVFSNSFFLRALKRQLQSWFPPLTILLWNSTSISDSIPLRKLSWKLKATGEFPFSAHLILQISTHNCVTVQFIQSSVLGHVRL